MRQLTAIEASNDEMERQRFLAYMRTTCWKSDLTTFIDEEGDEVFYEQWVQGAWMGWQAALKSKQGEV
ncbi:hypothetical protein [Pantoea ananatis]|uniref:hypothetical protein n=1 Tax=Pantoea ananas TaxID=553 RepID=UPI001B315076|nr:hypothetical protein [Pantoea ananatis]